MNSPSNTHVQVSSNATLHDGNFKPLIRKCLAKLGNDPTACNYMKYWDVSRVTDCSVLFWEQINDNHNDWRLLPGAAIFDVDLGGWNTSSCTTMRSMFNSATKFNHDIGNWDVSAVVDMSRMFQSAQTFDQDLSAWSTSQVTDMSHLFRYALRFNNGNGNAGGLPFSSSSSENTADTSNNNNLLSWDVARVERFQFMFHDADSFQADIGNWDVSNAHDNDNDNDSTLTTTSAFGSTTTTTKTTAATAFGHMFQGAGKFNNDISRWSIQGAKSLRFMFEGASSFNQDLSAWDISGVADFTSMFEHATSFNQTLCWNLNLSSSATNHNLIKSSSMMDGTPGGAQLDPTCKPPSGDNILRGRGSFQPQQQQEQELMTQSYRIMMPLAFLVAMVLTTCYLHVRGRWRKRQIIFRTNTKVEEEEVLFQSKQDEQEEDVDNDILITSDGRSSLFDSAFIDQQLAEEYDDLDYDEEELEEEGVVSFVHESIPAAPAFVPTMDGDQVMISLERHAVEATLAILPPSSSEGTMQHQRVSLNIEDGTYLT